MVLFGPVYAIPQDAEFAIFNLSSTSETIPRLPGLIVDGNGLELYEDGAEKAFDLWYYEYILNDITACSSLMSILNALYQYGNVYICITEYDSYPFISVINESFMKILQTRYGIKYSIINNIDDYMYIDHDGCDFMTVEGINNFDEDLRRFRLLEEESRIK